MPSCYGRASKKAHSVALAPHGRKGPAVSESYLAGREVMHGARRILLTRTEYSLFDLRMRRNGHAARRENLIEAVWGLDSDVHNDILDAFIRLLLGKWTLAENRT